jgi:hypothetical protein
MAPPKPKEEPKPAVVEDEEESSGVDMGAL